MMKKNAVAYTEPAITTKRQGMPWKYGKKIKLFDLFDAELNFIKAPMPGDSQMMIEYFVIELFWRSLGTLVKFVLVRHPEKGNSIVMSTDRSIEPMDIIFGYSLRFKIEIMFKQAVHQIGTFMYRFWLKIMLPNKRGKAIPGIFKKFLMKRIDLSYLLCSNLNNKKAA